MTKTLPYALVALAIVFHALWTDQQPARFLESDEALIHEHAVRLAFEIQNNELELKDIGKFVDPMMYCLRTSSVKCYSERF